jgi:methionyl aminopeptidase
VEVLRRHRPPRVLKTPGQIRRMQAAGRVVHEALRAAREACVVGATTAEIDEAAAAVVDDRGAESVLCGFPGAAGSDPYPARTCVSVNDEVVHGIPGGRRLRSGDIVTIDCAVSLAGWCADAAVAVEVGRVDAERRRLVEATELALATAILMIRADRWWSEIALTMQAIARDAGYGIVPGFVGHGIGRRLHEPPQVPSLVTPGFLRHHDFRLRPGMTL